MIWASLLHRTVEPEQNFLEQISAKYRKLNEVVCRRAYCLRLKFVPEILFRFDSTVEKGAHIMELLREIEQEEKEKKDTGHE